MQDLIAQGNAPIGVNVPAPLNGEKLWDLDVDSDLWLDLAKDAQSQDGDAPKWLYDQPTRQGIRAMIELQCCKEEFEWLYHERSAMYAWLQGQGEQLQLASCIAQGKWYYGYCNLLLNDYYSINDQATPCSFTRLNSAAPT